MLEEGLGIIDAVCNEIIAENCFFLSLSFILPTCILFKTFTSLYHVIIFQPLLRYLSQQYNI